MTPVAEQLDLIGAREENEWRIFGPPGCGKTTHLGRQIKRAVDKYGPDSILVTSFSRAAATELIGRDLPISRERIGTLHAHCYRALGRPPIAETKTQDWNERHPHWSINSAHENDVDEAADDRTGGSKDGDQLLAIASRWRNRKVPSHLWPSAYAQNFYREWCAWKDEHGLMDFTDLLERAAADCPIAPNNPRVIFADEAQDFTRLQLEIVRKWGRHTDYFLVVGDDDQTIYSFTGATPDAFLKPDIPPEQKIVLSQSYRVPHAVHSLASRWIQQVSHREPKEYRPTPEEGEVQREFITYRKPGPLVARAEAEIAEGRTVMFLAACSYMLQPIRGLLMNAAIPFHNPYRRRRSDWNPLHSTTGVSAAERIASFAKPHHSMGDRAQPWTAADYRRWADWVAAQGNFTHGGKSAAKGMPDDTEITLDHLHEWLTPDAYDSLMRGIMGGPLPEHLRWWLYRVQKEHAKTAAYPALIATRRGIRALNERPKVILGTIHSVKGGEADTVFLFPDLSAAAAGSWVKPGEDQDAIIRQFYVGMTRARHRLVICYPAQADFGVRL